MDAMEPANARSLDRRITTKTNKGIRTMARVCTAALIALGFFTATRAGAAERLCDASAENCRTPLIDLINNEHQGIDVGVWFFKDDRFVTALVNAKNRGVP